MTQPVTYPKKLLTIGGTDVFLIAPDVLQAMIKLDVDGDGSGGNRECDPDYQPDTSLHFQGKPLNARRHIFAALPPELIRAVEGTVLGCKVHFLNTENGRECWGIAGDVGPEGELGEASIATADGLGIASSPTNGGTKRRIVQITIYAGIRGMIAGLLVALKPFKTLKSK